MSGKEANTTHSQTCARHLCQLMANRSVQSESVFLYKDSHIARNEWARELDSPQTFPQNKFHQAVQDNQAGNHKMTNKSESFFGHALESGLFPYAPPADMNTPGKATDWPKIQKVNKSLYILKSSWCNTGNIYLVITIPSCWHNRLWNCVLIWLIHIHKIA